MHCRAVAYLTVMAEHIREIFSILNSSNQEIHLKVLREIEGNPSITQRQLAQNLGVSLGKANYCLRALIDHGWVKVKNFKNSKNKAAYAYFLTPNGMEEKARITVQFLKQRMFDYEQIKREIDELEAEVIGYDVEKDGTKNG